jgi:delta-aminolevulinic acid dehydratase/porphobilinogen synthase
MRDLVADTTFSVAQLIQPLFVVEHLTGAHPIAGLGDNARLGEAAALEQIARDLDAGVRHFLLFAVPAGKMRPGATDARPRFSLRQRSTAAIKQVR